MFPSMCELIGYSPYDVLEVVHSPVAFLSPVVITLVVLVEFCPIYLRQFLAMF